MTTTEGPPRTRWPDLAAVLPSRLPVRAWVLTLVAFLLTYMFMFSVVHVLADTRPCTGRIDDPLFRLVAQDLRWFFVTHTVYYVVNGCGTVAFLWCAWKGDHRPFVRFILGLTLQAAMRSITIWLTPLCRWTVAPGTIVLTEVPTLDLGLFHLPFRGWATNDLVFSGHIGEFLLMMWAAGRSWPAPARWGLIIFQLLQAYGLLATRGHYAIDLVVAVPCAFLANYLAMRALHLVASNRARVKQHQPRSDAARDQREQAPAPIPARQR
jgi:hypothetical protein